MDLNQRPSGYEPDELPGCSTPQRHCIIAQLEVLVKTCKKGQATRPLIAKELVYLKLNEQTPSFGLHDESDGVTGFQVFGGLLEISN